MHAVIEQVHIHQPRAAGGQCEDRGVVADDEHNIVARGGTTGEGIYQGELGRHAIRPPAARPTAAPGTVSRCLHSRQRATAAHFPRAACISSARHSAAALSSTPLRSEEDTSELQSLMRISYAVFCLKKKKKKKRQTAKIRLRTKFNDQ